MRARVELAPITEVLRTIKPYRPEPPFRRFRKFTTLISSLFALWILCLGTQTGWNAMISNAKFYAPDPVLAAAYKAQLDYNHSIGEHYYYFHLPAGQTDGRTEVCHFKGRLNSVWDLPMEGNKEYDAYFIGHTAWIWAVPKAGGKLQWIDP